MLSPESVRVLGKMLNFGHLLGYSPYSYSHKYGKVNFDDSRRTRRKYLMVLSVELMYFIYLAIQSIRTVRRTDVMANEKFKSVYFFMIHVTLYFGHWMTLSHWGEHHKILNGVLQTVPMISKTEFNGSIKGPVQIQRTLSGICICSLFGVATRSLPVFTFPETPEVFTSLATDPKSTHFVLKCLTAMAHYYINGFPVYGLILHGLPIYGFVCSILPLLKAIRIKRGRHAHGRRCWGWPYLTLSKVYTRLAILHYNFSNIYGFWAIGFQVSVCAISSVNLFMAVVFKGLPFLFNGVVFGFYTLFIFDHFAEIHTLASEAIESWKWPTRCPLWFRKFRRSARPIRINVGNFYFSDKALVMTILAVIIDRSTTLILTFRET